MDKHEHLDALYRQHMKSLYYYLYKMCGNAELAEDLVQETFVRATIHLQYADAMYAKAWLFQVARMAERRRKNPLFQLFLKQRDMCSPYGLPEQEMIEKECTATRQSLLAQLPATYRTVYILREDEQFSYREISKLLRISQGNVKVVLHRARKKMGDVVKGEMNRYE